MIDLTNFEHKRGVVILNSKDMRCVCRNLFDYRVLTDCIENYTELLRYKIDKIEMSEEDRKDLYRYIASIDDWRVRANSNIDKAREIFR